MSETLTVIEPIKLTKAHFEAYKRSELRRACITGAMDEETGEVRTGLEVLFELLGYSKLGQLGKVHKDLCKMIEEVNPYIAIQAMKKQKYDENDDIQWGRRVLEKRASDKPLKRLFLLARGHLKTTLISNVHTVQLLLIDPNIRILIMHHKLQMAVDIMAKIKTHFIFNQDFRDLFPEYCPTGKDGKIEWGTTEAVTLPNRTLNFLQEPTLDTSSVESIKTGGHYDYMKKDDLVTQKSVTNETQLMQSIDADKMTLYLFDNYEKSPEDYIGTRYHFGDLYAKKLKDIPRKMIVPAILEDGSIAWPEKFTKEGLEEIRVREGSYQFQTQLMLNPIDPEQQIFRKEWIQWYEKRPEKLNTYLFVDPSSSKKQWSDYTAMICIGIDSVNNIYILDIIRDKLTVTQRVDEAWGLGKKHQCKMVGWESNGFQETDVHLLTERRIQDPFKMAIKEIKSYNQKKEDRIRALQPYYERGQVFWPSEMIRYNKSESKMVDYIAILLMEMECFPHSEHDDLLDAHSFMCKIQPASPEMMIQAEDPMPKEFREAKERHMKGTMRKKCVMNFSGSNRRVA